MCVAALFTVAELSPVPAAASSTETIAGLGSDSCFEGRVAASHFCHHVKLFRICESAGEETVKSENAEFA